VIIHKWSGVCLRRTRLSNLEREFVKKHRSLEGTVLGGIFYPPKAVEEVCAGYAFTIGM
jgi:hypothetical protein